MSEEKEEQEKLTPEQLEANRKKAIEYYKRQNEVLELQAKHEGFMADIEVSRARRMEMIIRQAQMAAGPEADTDPEKKDTPEGDTKLRALKK
jgi:hypothetical protein